MPDRCLWLPSQTQHRTQVSLEQPVPARCTTSVAADESEPGRSQHQQALRHVEMPPGAPSPRDRAIPEEE